MIVIIFCLFPLWPKKIRKGAGWLSWIAVLFLLAVLVVGIIKYLLFSVLYILSARKLRLVAKKIHPFSRETICNIQGDRCYFFQRRILLWGFFHTS